MAILGTFRSSLERVLRHIRGSFEIALILFVTLPHLILAAFFTTCLLSTADCSSALHTVFSLATVETLSHYDYPIHGAACAIPFLSRAMVLFRSRNMWG